MKNIQINESPIGAQSYHLVEMVNGDTYVYPQKLGIPSNQATAADILMYDRESDTMFILKSDTDFSQYPADRYVPIGVVVVPGTHDVYGDGSCGVMSLKSMDCDTPSTGYHTEQSMYWGEQGTDISSLPNLTQAPIVSTGSSAGDTSSTVTGQNKSPHLPSDKFSAVQCPHDTDAYYCDSFYSSYKQAPSPYLTDGSRNPAYYQTTSPSSSSNALADFDGIGNTEKIITQRGSKDYNSWTPGRTTEADYPAASCCDMFHTEGTSQGDWYLPACGELGYIMPPFNKINEALTNMRNAYGLSVGATMHTVYSYWSSTEDSNTLARCIDKNDGHITRSDKRIDCYVRAWLRFNNTLRDPH